MTVRFTPPYPVPHASKSSLARRFMRGWNSWIHVLFDKSYTMKMGEIHTPGMDFYIANELALVDRIMVDEWRRFPKHRFLQHLLDPLIGSSVFSANGQAWEDQRAMVNPAFSHTALGRVFPAMAAAVDDLMTRIAASDFGKPVRIDPLMTQVAADIIFRTMFSVKLSDAEATTIHRAFHDYQRHAQSTAMLRVYALPTLGFRGKAMTAARRIHAVFEPIVRARYDGQAEEQPDDILAALLAARHPTTQAPFSFDEVMRQVSTIFLAGHETAASAMTWALYLIAAAPELQADIRAEVAAAGTLDAAALRAMPVTRNVFRETLRLYPPIGFFVREVTEPTAMRDKQLAEGAMLVVSPWLIQRNREHWDDPHGFDETRFDHPEAQAACRHAYLPFGKGPRVCIGAGFAQQEAMLVIAAVTSRYRLAPVADDLPEPVSRLTLRPKTGLRLMLTPIDG